MNTHFCVYLSETDRYDREHLHGTVMSFRFAVFFHQSLISSWVKILMQCEEDSSSRRQPETNTNMNVDELASAAVPSGWQEHVAAP